jgi:sirohydrochlorin cobaltochelatase
MKALLLASFGTTDQEALQRDIGGWEKALIDAFPDRQSFRAFTSGVVRKRLVIKLQLAVDSPEEALAKMVEQGYDDILVVSGHILPGIEYDKLLQAVAKYSEAFARLYIAKPLMYDARSIHQVFACARGAWPTEKNTMHVLFGHGSEHEADIIYRQLETEFDDNAPGYTVGTVEGELSLDAVLERLEARQRRKVVLHPLMLVAGDHARNDMAGDDNESWLSVLTEQGYEVEPHMEGLGAQADFCNLFLERAQAALGDASAPDVRQQNSAGKFYLVGVGPGAADLITLRAARTIGMADIIAFPYSSKSDKRVALDVALPHLNQASQQLPLHFPMTTDRSTLDDAWDDAARQVASELDSGKSTAFITIGDAMLYSTGLYLAQRLATLGYVVEVVPGVPSFCAAAAATLTPLAQEDEVFAVVPLARTGDNLTRVFDCCDCVAVLKPSSRLDVLQQELKNRGLDGGAVCVSLCGTAEESTMQGPEIMKADSLPYLSTLLVHKNPQKIKDNRLPD